MLESDTVVPRIRSDLPLFEVVGLMNRSRADAAVVEADGETVGVITAADLAAACRSGAKPGVSSRRTSRRDAPETVGPRGSGRPPAGVRPEPERSP